MKLTINQWLGIAVGVLGVFGSVTSQLTDLFGAVVAKDIVSLSSILSGVAGVFVAVLTSQSNQVLDVKAMDGVDKIMVNKNASSALAKLAVDPAEDKIEASPGAEAAVIRTARS